ncbi:MAG: hypothetical protein AAFR88_12345, partial [Pseudomonadota bacterium]
TLVSHSFELINRRTQRANRIVQRRFDGLCRALSETPGVTTGCYRTNPPRVAAAATPSTPLEPKLWRTGQRYAEQALSNTLYGAL